MTRSKTIPLPGVEGAGVAPVHIKEIEDLADKYVAARDKRMTALGKEVDAKTELIAALHANAEKIGKNPDDGAIRYEYDGGDKDRRVIMLKPSSEKLKVKDVEAFEEANVT